MTNVETNASNAAQATTGSSAAEPLNLDRLSESDRKLFLQLAANGVAATVTGQALKTPPAALEPEAKRIVMGVFVTLKRGEILRSCCGVLGKPMPVGAGISAAAVRAPNEDKRFASISPSELPFLDLDVTLLGPFKKLGTRGEARADAIELGKHGILVQRGEKSGLLLPAIAVDREWSAQQFLEATCVKADLPPNAWQDDDCSVMTFDGKSMKSSLADLLPEDLPREPASLISAEQLSAYAQIAGQNIVAIATGATPSYVIPQLPDVTVNALVLSIEWGASEEDSEKRQGNAIQVSFRPGVPLQSTLFQMCQHAARMFQQQRFSGELKVGLTIGQDPANHGFGPAADVSGVDPAKRAVLISDPAHCGFAFHPERTPTESLESLHQSLPVGSRDAAVHSMHVMSTLPNVICISAPSGTDVQGVRPPAVAGKFYPAEDAARRARVSKVLEGFSSSDLPAPNGEVLGLLVPHAGLKYSGKVAAKAWAAVGDLHDRTLIVVSPKHTQNGINWSVCPFDRWRLSTTTEFQADRALAERLAAEIDDLELDAAAHHGEHGIEVQLPLLEQLASDVKVVGLALHGGSWDDLQAAAKQFAEVYRSMERPPLLVISSDLNHYAPDAENRRRDRLALDAFATGDPEHLIDVCKKHTISMCGLVSAAFVMETFRQLEKSFEVLEIDYATSADATGDKSQVVGYAGALMVAKA